MSKAVLFLLATTLGLGFVSMHLVRELRAEREQTLSLQARIGELERIAKPSIRAQTPPQPTSLHPEPSRSKLPPATTANAAPPAAVSDVSFGPGGSVSYSYSPAPTEDVLRQLREHEERQRALLQDPEYREAMRAQQKMYQAQTYPDLGKELELSEEEADRFMELLTDQQLRAMENAIPRGWNPASPDPVAMEEMQRKAQQQQQTNEAEQANLLGPVKFQAWKDYQSTLGVRYQVAQMRATFASKGAPLQESQIKPLIKALAEDQERAMKDWRADQGLSDSDPALALNTGVFASYTDGTILMSSDSVGQGVEIPDEKNVERIRLANKRARDAVSGVLTPQQLKLFEAERNEQLKMQQAQMRIMRAQNRAQPDG